MKDSQESLTNYFYASTTDESFYFEVPAVELTNTFGSLCYTESGISSTEYAMRIF